MRAFREQYAQPGYALAPPVMASLQAEAIAAYPPALNWSGVRELLRGDYGPALNPAIKVCLAWPLLTFATLMIYRASMRQAKVRTIHVVRCVIYGCNAALWIGLPASAFFPLHGTNHTLELTEIIAIYSAVLAAINFYSLGCAYRRYLRFDHPWAAIAASQIIVGLVFCVLTLNSGAD